MKYVIYIRVSTDQQADSGLGIDAQRDLCLNFIKSKGDFESIEFIDEGYSGALSMDKRPNLLLAIDSLEKGDFIIVAKRDRLGRDIIVNAMIESAIERKKAFLVSASGDFKNDGDPSSILMKRMMDAFAEYERLIIGARTKAAMAVLKKNGKRAGYIPYGYKLCEDKVHIEECSEEQHTLKLIQELREDGWTFREIADHLNSINRIGRKGAWNHVSIFRKVKLCNG